MSELGQTLAKSPRIVGPAPARTAYNSKDRCVQSDSGVTSHHGFKRYLCPSVAMQSSEMMSLPVKQWAKSFLANFKLGGGTRYIDEAIDLDREGTCVFLAPCRTVK